MEGSQDTGIRLVRANDDMVRFLDGDELFHYHVLGYSWKEGTPVLELLPLREKDDILYKDGGPFDLDLSGISDISYRFGGPSVCTGRTVEGEYMPCPFLDPPSESFSRCIRCLLQDIPDPTCIFEPHCHTEPCGAHFCQVPHVVYLTAFRSSLKVGMTQFRRMKERAMEQGADGMLPLILLKDRYSARYFEGAISSKLGLPQVVRSGTKLANLSMRRDLSAVEEVLIGAREDLKMFFDDILKESSPSAYVLEGPSEFDHDPILIDDYPLEEPLPSGPKRFKGERARGRVIGFKGSYMFFRQGGIWAYRLSEVPGRILHTGMELKD